jgi:hypothetical protein
MILGGDRQLRRGLSNDFLLKSLAWIMHRVLESV